MARPKRIKGELSVPERIENTFFEMLSEMFYDDITVAALARRTGVNHNTFYYYFNNIDSLVLSSVEEILSSDVPEYLLNDFTGNVMEFRKIAKKQGFQERYKRAALLSGKNSTSWIINVIKDSILKLWFESFGIREEQLPEEKLLVFHFWLGGVFSILGNDKNSQDLMQVISVFDDEIVSSFVSFIIRLKTEIEEGAYSGC